MNREITFECNSIYSSESIKIIGNSCPIEFDRWLLNCVYLSVLRATTPGEIKLRQQREAPLGKHNSPPQHINIQTFADELFEIDIDEMGLYGFTEPVESLVRNEKNWWESALVHVGVFDGLHWNVVSNDAPLLSLIRQSLSKNLPVKFEKV